MPEKYFEEIDEETKIIYYYSFSSEVVKFFKKQPEVFIKFKENIKKIFKNDKIVFLTNIITYVMFAIIVYLMQNSIVQEIKLGQRNNTCK
mgnify:CR=1 FL=1